MCVRVGERERVCEAKIPQIFLCTQHTVFVAAAAGGFFSAFFFFFPPLEDLLEKMFKSFSKLSSSLWPHCFASSHGR